MLDDAISAPKTIEIHYTAHGQVASAGHAEMCTARSGQPRPNSRSYSHPHAPIGFPAWSSVAWEPTGVTLLLLHAQISVARLLDNVLQLVSQQP